MVSIPTLKMEHFGLAPPRFKPGFFVDYRKGEIGELRLLLRKMALDNQCASTTERFVSQIVHTNMEPFIYAGINRRRDILKRLIACMTMGIDLSSLYTDVVMVSQTDDPVQKKMIYLYLSTYSVNNPDLAILAINTLLKDIDNLDPVIRSLALRNISSFGTSLSIEYATSSVLKKMFDPSDSVKRTAIIGSIRVIKSKDTLENKAVDDYGKNSILNDLKMALKSSNVHVMIDAMCAIAEISDSGKICLTASTIIYLANCLKNMNEWEQCTVLEVLNTYVPSSNDELFDLMNLLDDRLKHSSSAIVLATAKCFIKWTKNDANLQLEVINRLQVPLISLLNRTRDEIAYTLLVNILSIIVNVSKIIVDEELKGHKIPFIDYFEVFFCRYDDPPYIKNVKLNILIALSTTENCELIANELNEYISDTNHEIANRAILALGIIALKIPSNLNTIVERMSVIFSLQIPYLTTSLLLVIKVLLRVYSGRVDKLLEVLKNPGDSISYPQAKANYISILGEFGYDLDHTPYTLEDYINEAQRPDVVTLELLLASVRVFLKRPPEMFDSLSRLLKSVLTESNNPDLVSCAQFYYNLLSNIDVAREIFEGEYQVEPNVYILMDHEKFFMADNNWREKFNTIHLIDQCRGYSSSVYFPYEYGDVDIDIFKHEHVKTEVSIPECIPVQTNTEVDDLLPLIESVREKTTGLELVHPSTLLSDEFQKNWFEIEQTCSKDMEITISSVNIERLELILSQVYIITLASGKAKDVTKFYLYTEDVEG
ncbi:Adaptin N terminal region domain containing protein [Theileria equi strain WA]|uniref:Adaptin N terminal region domain containing protein n=1 Tax=Theileria equi strain WA TaxID=1537102 RepID=L1LEQ2_THEEQ|nr:Adaptin N terminal region domain containing protein [Theileria equi strain WA]EKX73917.1 Adaptin N terminal region domain containing protein [Theileria equi strain WA]|eukprot:XP_004833369.1 Adaptin N terminal region domain containing protein [Theileria equi strain WA]